MRRISTYIHELPDWPTFRWADEILVSPLAGLRHRQGRIIGQMESFGFSLRTEAVLNTLTVDVLKSSEIEGEVLDKKQVRSSLARRLGVNVGALEPVDRNIEGVVEMILDATQKYDDPLTKERLFGWHASLFPSGYSGMRRIRVGAWRDDSKGPMQVVSGPIGKERVHFQAPASTRLEYEMKLFLDWFNHDEGSDWVIRAGLAHLWFVTIHPFADGNRRIARAIADLGLARSEQSSQRFYSMSSQIRKECKLYYKKLEQTQRGSLDVTSWLTWFLDCLHRTFDNTEETLSAVFKKANFWKLHADASINSRQRLMLNKLLNGFEGKLTTSKWAQLTKCSQDTAFRDIVDLVASGILSKDSARGRSTSYSLVAF